MLACTADHFCACARAENARKNQANAQHCIASSRGNQGCIARLQQGAYSASVRVHEQNVRKNGVTEAEVEAAKAETLNSFVFNFASTSSQLLQSLGCELLGLPQVCLLHICRTFFRQSVELDCVLCMLPCAAIVM